MSQPTEIANLKSQLLQAQMACLIRNDNQIELQDKIKKLEWIIVLHKKLREFDSPRGLSIEKLEIRDKVADEIEKCEAELKAQPRRICDSSACEIRFQHFVGEKNCGSEVY